MESLAGGRERPGQVVVAVEGTVGVPYQEDHPGGQGGHHHQGHHGVPHRPQAAHPTRRAVEPAPPKRMVERRKFSSTTTMIETRMARPADTPTPAGPPEAR